MRALLRNTFLHFNKVKVVHSLPGRVRLSMPGLSQIPSELKTFEPRVTELIELAGGIEEVSYSYITNKVLLKYNNKVISEDGILEWMNIIWKEVVRREEYFASELTHEDMDLVYEEIKTSLLKIKG